MKIKILLGLAVVALLSVAAFVMTGSATEIDAEKMMKLRGTEAYYAESDLIVAAMPIGEQKILANLTGENVCSLNFDFKYRIGKEWQATPEVPALAIAEKSTEIRSALIILLTGKKADEFSGAALRATLEQIIEAINDVVFPLRRARVEEIVIRELFCQ